MRDKSTLRRRATRLIVGITLLIASSAHADETINVFARIDNDLFTGTDREYTSGVEAGFTTATVESSMPCPATTVILPFWARKRKPPNPDSAPQ